MIATLLIVAQWVLLRAAICVAIAATVSGADALRGRYRPACSALRGGVSAMACVAFPAYFVASLTGMAFAFGLVNWWAPVLADKDGKLPRWLSWFQTFDASLDAGWRDGYYVALAETIQSASGLQRWWALYRARLYWLYRNPGYGIDYWLLGLTFQPEVWRVVANVARSDLVLFVAVGNGFNAYCESRFGQVKIGWKAWNYWQDTEWRATPWGPAWRVPVCVTVTPFKRRAQTAAEV